uniref:Nucleoprotein TPR-like n=1 Tax=Saccoglossus kowalevskii TaxID=10224 RepID=A0ABM0GPB2_SACKO|nr:PREDICTED: nucleoprotein TPR-like [Saccoglossus kowalevskii]
MATSVKFACLLSVIDENELEALPQEIRSKLEDTISSKESAIEKSKAENERLKVNAEQQYFELEKQLISCSAKLETINSERNELKTENTDLETKYKLAQERLRELEDNKEGSLSTQLQLSRTNEQLETDKRDLVELVEKKNQEIERLNDEWHDLSEKLGASNTAKVQAQAKLDELLGEDVTAKYREKRLEQEKDLLSQQNDWMSKELKEKTNELLAFKRTKSAEILELKTTLETQSEELKHSQEVFETVKKTNEIQSSRIEALIQKVKDVHDAAAQNEEQSRNELAAQTKLTGLYKSVADEFKGKETEMMTTIEELQKILRQTTESHTEMEDQMKEIEEKHIEKERLLEEKVESLEKELVHANDLIAVAKRKGISPLSESELSTLSPTAAAASSLLKSGMTLTQMYSAYVESSDDLQLEKEENRRLNMYLDQILKEIEEKAPVLQKQREDYEKSLQTIDQLSRRLDGAMLECEKLRVTADESERKAAQQLRENNRMVQQTSDLGQQVRVLLKEIEEARGHVSGSHEAHVSSSDISSSNIEELQEQNQQLLTVVRELSSKREQEEKATRDEELSEVHEKLEKALEEIDELRTSRNRQG